MLVRRILAAVLLLPLRLAAQAPEPVTVPALTPVVIRLDEVISSNKHKPGDRFMITVAEDVRVGEVIVIPAGSSGEGEVIHAAKSGAGGKAGELILAARFVRVGETELRLRSFALGAVGRDRTDDALATGIVAGPFAMFVRGGVVVVPQGTLGTAKTALEFHLPAVPVTPPESIQPTKGGGEDESKTD
jgi:hypothetical protein